MRLYTNPLTLQKDSKNKYLLRINSKECKVLLAALKQFNSLEATNSPDTSSLQGAINEIDAALNGKDVKTNVSYNAPDPCPTCLN